MEDDDLAVQGGKLEKTQLLTIVNVSSSNKVLLWQGVKLVMSLVFYHSVIAMT